MRLNCGLPEDLLGGSFGTEGRSSESGDAAPEVLPDGVFAGVTAVAGLSVSGAVFAGAGTPEWAEAFIARPSSELPSTALGIA